MNNNKISKFVNPIRSLKLRVFVVIMLAIIIPALASSIFIVNVTTKNYLNNRINSFKANNTMLKNNIINNNYLDQSNENIDIVDAQIEQLAKEYNCRIQVVNSRYVIAITVKKARHVYLKMLLKVLRVRLFRLIARVINT